MSPTRDLEAVGAAARARVCAGRVLVTGATRGIGAAVVEALVARGAKVAAAGRDEARLEALDARFGARVHPLRADLMRADERGSLVARAEQALGGLDGFVSSAGIAEYEPALELSEASLRRQLECNLIAPALLTRDVAAILRARGEGGAIVHILSTLALRPAPLTSAYASSKGGLLSLVRTFAQELAADGVRVNALLPGIVDTEMIRADRPDGLQIEARLEAFAALHPLGRLGRVEEIAESVLHLLDAEWITGACLAIDGGLSIA
ncbi:MAG: SDR family oxidoreductase [Myxococcales bacterium]|nr:SDR family oxidoreductase [Myxococcales bacterium]